MEINAEWWLAGIFIGGVFGLAGGSFFLACGVIS